MKKVILATLSVLVVGYGCVSLAKHFWRGETKSVSAVEKQWGHEPFDAAKFKSGDYKARAKMAASMMTSKVLIGKSIDDIEKLLGTWDGYYFTDMFPAYIIQDGRIEKGDSWQIVFLLDKNYKTSEIIVHKNQ